MGFFGGGCGWCWWKGCGGVWWGMTWCGAAWCDAVWFWVGSCAMLLIPTSHIISPVSWLRMRVEQDATGMNRAWIDVGWRAVSGSCGGGIVLYRIVQCCAALRFAVLYCAVVPCAVVCCDVLCCVVRWSFVLCDAVLCGGALCCAVLCCAVLCCVHLVTDCDM